MASYNLRAKPKKIPTDDTEPDSFPHTSPTQETIIGQEIHPTKDIRDETNVNSDSEEDFLGFLEVDTQKIDTQSRAQSHIMSENSQDILLQILQKLNSTTDEIKSSLESKLNSTKEEIKLEMNANRQEMRLMHSQLIEQLNTDMDTRFNNERLYVEKKLQETHTEIGHIKTNLTKLETEMVQHNQDINNKIRTIELERKSTVRRINNQEVKLDKIEKHITEIKSDLDTREQNFNTSTEEPDTQKVTMDTIQQIQEELKNELQRDMRNTIKDMHQINREIIINCSGNTTSNTNLPPFNGKNVNPMIFLNKLKTYIEKETIKQNRPMEVTELKILIEGVMSGNTTSWWQFIQDSIESLDDFESMFISKFWSRDIQRSIKRRMEYEKYKPGGKLNRAEYFMERAVLLQNTTINTPNEEEIIIILSEHFGPKIQDACSIQGIKTITAMERLLAKEDSDENNKQLRTQNRNTEQNSQQNNRNNYRNKTFIGNEPPRYESNNRNRPNFNPNWHHNNRYQHNNRPPWDSNNNHNAYNRQIYDGVRHFNKGEHRYRPTEEQKQVCTLITRERETDKQSLNLDAPGLAIKRASTQQTMD